MRSSKRLSLVVVFSALVLSLFSACSLEELVAKAKAGNVDSATVVRLRAYAGRYPVTTLRGVHVRDTVILGTDGSLDFDNAVIFTVANYQELVDTAVVGDSLGGFHFRVDIKPFGGKPLRRVKLYVDTVGHVLLKAAYYPDLLGSDSVVVVQRLINL